MKYRRKPATIDAYRLNPDNFLEICRWLGEERIFGLNVSPKIGIALITQSGRANAYEGDWIVTDEFGDFLIYDHEAFQEEYEAAQ